MSQKTMLEIGSFPYQVSKGKVQIMLITTTSGNTWILPKGQPESDLNRAQVAELETYEEAGVKGKVLNPKKYKNFERENGGTLVVYPLLIKKILAEWPEKSIRKRRLVTIQKALSLVSKKEHLDAINYFSSTEVIKKISG